MADKETNYRELETLEHILVHNEDIGHEKDKILVSRLLILVRIRRFPYEREALSKGCR